MQSSKRTPNRISGCPCARVIPDSDLAQPFNAETGLIRPGLEGKMWSILSAQMLKQRKNKVGEPIVRTRTMPHDRAPYLRNTWDMMLKRILFSLIVLLMTGCQNNEVNIRKADFRELKTSLTDANKKIEILKSRNTTLKSNLEKAALKCRNLQIQKTETDEWIGYMIKAIGPCVWVGGQSEKPIPREIVENAKPKDLINKLNQIFSSSGSPEATLVKVEGETAYIKVFEHEKLTQRMGTFGAASYINSIVYTMYSVEAIKCVDLDFEEGDHAFPGTYCPGRDHKKESIKSTEHEVSQRTALALRPVNGGVNV
jgi:hypothetical protein